MLNHRFVRRLLLLVFLLWTGNIVWRILCAPFAVENTLIVQALLCTLGFLVLARREKIWRKK